MRLFALILLLPIVIILFILFFPIIMKIIFGLALLSVATMILTFIISLGKYSFAKDQNNFLFHICRIGEIASILILCIIISNIAFDTIGFFEIIGFLYL